MLGKRLRVARTKKKLSLRAVADAMGVTPQAVSQWERSNPAFEFTKVRALANLLEVTFEWLEGQYGTDDQVDYRFEITKEADRIKILSRAEISASMVHPQHSSTKSARDAKTLEATIPILGSGFAFEVDTDALLPEIAVGDIIIFDDAVRARDGDVVYYFAAYSDGSLKFSPGRADRIENRHIKETGAIEAAKLGDDVQSYLLDDGTRAIIFAVMVEHRRFRSG